MGDAGGVPAPNGEARRILVFGWGDAAARVLGELAACAQSRRVEVRCVSHASQAPDCDLREVCAGHGFACSLTDDDAEALALASGFGPELIISAFYRKKLSSGVLELARDCINFHPSLLPRHRGCWSGFWTIFEGDAETGVTCHRMVEEFDKGRIVHQEKLAVAEDDTSASIYKKILPVTAVCARRVLDQFFSAGLPEGEEQRGPASYHRRHLPFQGLIQAEWPDVQVERFIRAMHFPPFDGAALRLDAGRTVLVDSLGHVRALRRGAAAAGAAASAAGAAAAAGAGAPAGAPAGVRAGARAGAGAGASAGVGAPAAKRSRLACVAEPVCAGREALPPGLCGGA